MVNCIVNGISNGLKAAFGGECTIYPLAEPIHDFQRPCFCINLHKATQEAKLKGRYLRRYAFLIRYYPGPDGAYPDMARVADKLYDVLEVVALEEDDALRGTDMSYEMADGVVSFQVNYVLFFYKKDEDISMETAVIHTNTQRKDD